MARPNLSRERLSRNRLLCSNCRNEMPPECFSRNRTNEQTGYDNICKRCRRILRNIRQWQL